MLLCLAFKKLKTQTPKSLPAIKIHAVMIKPKFRLNLVMKHLFVHPLIKRFLQQILQPIKVNYHVQTFKSFVRNKIYVLTFVVKMDIVEVVYVFAKLVFKGMIAHAQKKDFLLKMGHVKNVMTNNIAKNVILQIQIHVQFVLMVILPKMVNAYNVMKIAKLVKTTQLIA